MTERLFAGCSIILMLFLASCAAQKYFYNQRYPQTAQQASYNSDISYCNAVAYGMAPMPPVNLQPTGPTYTSGTLIGNNGYVGSYTGTTYQDTSMATMSNLLSLSSALAAQNARQNIAASCMANIGWFEVEKGYLPPSQTVPTPTAGKEGDAREPFSQGGVAPFLAKVKNALADAELSENDPAFLGFAQQAPTEDASGQPLSFDDQVKWAIDKTIEYKAAERARWRLENEQNSLLHQDQ